MLVLQAKATKKLREKNHEAMVMETTESHSKVTLPEVVMEAYQNQGIGR